MTEVDECKEMVEANWKAFLTFAAQGSGELGRECLARFDEKVAQQARAKGADGERWFALVEEQRSLVFDEYTTDPAALKRRLGVPEATQSLPRQPPPISLSAVAARTAVRATVWQSIAALFR